MALPFAHNHCFKPPSIVTDRKRRSPSPPHRFIEPLSPTKPHALEPQFNYPALDPHSSFPVQPKQPLTSGTPRARGQNSRHTHQRTPSTIDALAEAALATSPDSHGPARKSWGQIPPQPRTTQRPYGTNEPPHKRARSEYIPPTQIGLHASRPATSYGPNDGQAPHSYDSRVEEAALLLNFRTQGWPSNSGSPPQTSPPFMAFPRPHANSFPQSSSQPRPIEAGLLPPFEPQQPLAHRIQPMGVETMDLDRNMPADHLAPTAESLYKLEPTFPEHIASAIESSGRESADVSISESSDPPKARRGWPKGKPRGPRPRQSLTEKASAPRSSRRNQESSRAKKAKKSTASLASTDDAAQTMPRRKSFSDFEHSAIEALRTRARSVPRDVPMIVRVITTKPTRRKPDAGPETICAGCSTSRETKKPLGELDEWISCNGCKKWFHIDCAGFKKAIEVRDVDKYFCPECEKEHGQTTYVRKSKRAHASVDYAELQKGVLKTSEESPEHHYIQPIKDGTFKFDPEYFPRMRPELITREYFERSGTFVEPICIPAEWNPRPWKEHQQQSNGEDVPMSNGVPETGPLDHLPTEDFEFDDLPDLGQDRLDMVMPEEMTVRQVCNLIGSDYPLDVIDVKTQNSGSKWTLGKWADYYEEVGEDKAIRNVISLEVSQTRLGRLLRRPKVVRDIDLQDEVWPKEETDKGKYPKVQFYCLMSCADSYTDFHIDFGGSSVYYHILRGKKTFFFIPPKAKHLKAYEEWNDSPQQNYTFLPHITKECYRVDLHEGDTMLIPSGWIHAVWTPADSLVIGGNFLTRMSFKNQFKVAEIEKNNETPMKFRYPFFQRLMWYTAMQYLEQDPIPDAVTQLFYEGRQFKRDIPVWNDFEGEHAAKDPRPGAQNARYYSEAEMDGLPDLANFIFRTVMMTLGRVEGISQDRMRRINSGIPKGRGEPLDVAKTFGLWVAWKRGNEDPPAWAHPDAVLPDEQEGAQQKKFSARALKDMERKEAIAAWRLAPDRQSARVQSKKDAVKETAAATIMATPERDQVRSTPHQQVHAWPAQAQQNITPQQLSNDHASQHQPTVVGANGSYISTPKTSVLGPKRVACDACRKRRIRCKHKDLVQQINNPGSAYSDFVLDPMLANDATKFEDDPVVSPSRTNGLAPITTSGYEQPAYPALGHEAATAIPATNVVQSDHIQAATMVNGHPDESLSTIPNGVSVFGEVPKRGRTKACVECRKSKRRCVHDEFGNIDPVKAAENPVPRGSLNPKKRQSTDNSTPVPVKKQKKSVVPSVMAAANSSPEDVHSHVAYAQPDASQDYHPVQANGTYSEHGQEHSTLDISLFAPFTGQEQKYGFGSLEQIANEVLDMNEREHEEAEPPQHEGNQVDGVHQPAPDQHTPPQDGSVDSGVGLSEDLPNKDATNIEAEQPVLATVETVPLVSSAPAVQPVAEESAVRERAAADEQHDTPAELPLYQPPAPVSLSPRASVKRAQPKVNGKSTSPTVNGNSATKRKRQEPIPTTPAAKGSKKVKTEAKMNRVVQESEDERLAKLLQQESLGLRRRS